MEASEIGQLKETFRQRFDGEPRFFRAPGRVNLIGEHTDYNDGFVLPFAIDRESMVAAAKRPDRTFNVYAADLDETVAIDLSAAPVKRRGSWIDFAEGVIRCIDDKFRLGFGADMAFSSTVPIGAGLSSSAAIEISMALAILAMNDKVPEKTEMAFAAQRAEHEFVGTRSGIMDQFASVFGRSGEAMLLDCRSLEIKYVPFLTSDTMVAVCDTKVKHSLASSQYNMRRRECEEGVKLLAKFLPDITALRDVTADEFEKYSAALPEAVRRRCAHVVSENQRTPAAAELFSSGDAGGAGKLMLESHRSLRDDYEVSCPELDLLVDLASDTAGIFGARMTGGGFGGCTVNLLEKRSFNKFREKIIAGYEKKFAATPDIYEFQATNGASEITAD